MERKEQGMALQSSRARAHRCSSVGLLVGELQLVSQSMWCLQKVWAYCLPERR